MGKPMKAAENFEVVDQLGASTAGSLFNLADIYANEKLYDLATSAYVRALEKDPTAKVDRVIRAAKFLSMSNAMDEMEALVDGIERARADSLSKDEKKELLKLRARLAVSRGAGEQEAAVLLESSSSTRWTATR
jgi:tetratricopeptide (TPR) repeat protein